MKKNYITKKSYEIYTKKFKQLIEERIYWVNEKRIAAELGDRSENAEYIYSKAEIRRVEKSLRKIQKIIDNAKVVELNNLPKTNKIQFGSYVEVENIDTNEILKFQIVGTNEIELEPTLYISNISPMGSKLIGLEKGDELEVNDNWYEILKIERKND